jgi:hypothetical protein
MSEILERKHICRSWQIILREISVQSCIWRSKVRDSSRNTDTCSSINADLLELTIFKAMNEFFVSEPIFCILQELGVKFVFDLFLFFFKLFLIQLVI